MFRNRLAQLLILTAAFNFIACGGAVEKTNTDGKAAVSTPGANASSPTPPANNAPAPTPSVGVATARPGTSPTSETRATGNAPPAKMPTPQVGSGGNDLFLFTQARAAVNADPELKAANLIIEVKEGVVTLSGTVASAALKSKAEQLARGAGPKDVRNQLKVSAGK